MKLLLYILFPILLFKLTSCDKPPVEEPKNLISEEKMIELLVDIHLAESTYSTRKGRDSTLKNSDPADFYHSVLNEYQMPDTVFVKSYVFYASQPKNFEKMYRRVMNKLNEMEQEFTGRKNDMLELEIQKN